MCVQKMYLQTCLKVNESKDVFLRLASASVTLWFVSKDVAVRIVSRYVKGMQMKKCL
jgi:hypothetical protein